MLTSVAFCALVLATCAPQEPQLHIRLVSPDGEPVAGALVHCVRQPITQEFELSQEFHAYPIRYARTHGHASTTDGSGSVRLPYEAFATRRTTLIAERGDLFALELIDYYPPDEVVVDMQRDTVREVLVVDHEGKPAAGVHLQHRLSHITFVRAVTNDLGIARIEHAQTIDDNPPNGSNNTVRVAEPGIWTSSQPLSDLAPGERARIELPPTVDVEIEVRGLPADLPPETKPMVWLQGRHEEIRDGVARFERVGADSRLRATAGLLGQSVELEFTTTSRAGATDRVAITLPENITVRARLVDPDGVAIEGPVEVRYAQYMQRIQPRMMGIRAGEFAMRLPPGKLAKGISFYVSARSDHAAHRGYTATLDETPPSRNGTIDLGNVVLRPAPLWASGQCIDQNGDANETPAWVGLSTADREIWDELRFVPLPNGRFELRGSLDVETVEVARGAFASGPTYATAVVARGSTDAKWTVMRYGSIDAHVCVAPRDASSVSVQLVEASSGAIATPTVADDQTEEVTRFSFRQIEPGTYALRVRLLTGPETLVKVEDIEIDKGRNRDARLAAVRLPSCESTTVTLQGFTTETIGNGGRRLFVGAHGEWHPHYLIDHSPRRLGAEFCLDRSWPPGWKNPYAFFPSLKANYGVISDVSIEFRQLHRSTPEAFWISVPGFLPTRVSPNDSTVRLQRSLVADLIVDAADPANVHFVVDAAPQPDVWKGLGLAAPPTGIEPGHWRGHQRVAAGQQGELILLGPGTYDLRVHKVTWDSHRPKGLVPVENFEPTTLTIEAGRLPPVRIEVRE